VTDGLNADFDGDTINVHVPSQTKAVKEAYDKLMPDKMLFSDRFRDKVVPNVKHEQVLGLYEAGNTPASKVHNFSSEKEAEEAIKRGDVELHDEVMINGIK